MHIAGSITPARKERVNRIRKLIDQGRYVTPQKIAQATEALLQEVIGVVSAPRLRLADGDGAAVHGAD